MTAVVTPRGASTGTVTPRVRHAADRGRTEIGWLDGRHSFSFGDFHDPAWHGWRTLRVINDDVIAPAGGFPTHPHRDMEIITWMLDGELEHRDSLGNGAVLAPGGVQHMTAGTGVFHSEFNASDTRSARLLQIWIRPRAKGLPPHYGQKEFPDAALPGRWTLLASGDGRDGSVLIQADADVRVGRPTPEATLRHELRPGRGAWLQVARGSVVFNGVTLIEGDGAHVEAPAASAGPVALEVAAVASAAPGTPPAEVLLFDLGA